MDNIRELNEEKAASHSHVPPVPSQSLRHILISGTKKPMTIFIPLESRRWRRMEYKLHPYNIQDLGTMPSAMNSAVAAIAHEIDLDFDTRSIRRGLSRSFRRVFESHGWEIDTNLHFEPARERTLHYYKDRILAQASWRHYNMIGTELLKFQVEYEKKRIDAGVFICITEELSERFKELYKASKKKNAFEGSITLEKVVRYLKHVSDVITVPLAIMGLTYS